MGAQVAPCGMDPAARRSKLTETLAQLDARIGELEAKAPPFAPPARSRAKDVNVTIGTSEQARNPAMVERIMTMVNESYYESMKELLHPRQKSYERLSRGEVVDRLQMGDAGLRANRVLHIAYRGDRLEPSAVVGCMSSTFQPPWTEEGCGHWGLLVVDKDNQGQGIASVLVASAELRLAGQCHEIQIEYEYTPGHDYSERLLAFYEGSAGFKCVNGYSRRVGTQFRKCRKLVPDELGRRGELQRMQDVRAALRAELESLPAASEEPAAPEASCAEAKAAGASAGASAAASSTSAEEEVSSDEDMLEQEAATAAAAIAVGGASGASC